jgi:hypothetical protein
MRLTKEESQRRFPAHPQPAPLQYAGEWVAWNADRTRIVAHGRSLERVHAEAVAAGFAMPLLQKVLGESFIGVSPSRA